MNLYIIRLRGQVDVNDLNPLSPHPMSIVRMDPTSTLIRIATDQSGMLGILRNLHNLGLTLLSVVGEEDQNEWEHENERKNDLAA